MEKHPIYDLMVTTMTSLRDMIDVNTIVGEATQSADGTLIIPISKVSFGFASGGSQFNTNKINKYAEEEKLPFGGGSGAGVNITPSAFLIVKNDNVKIINMTNTNSLDKVIDMVPDILEKTYSEIKEKRNIEKNN